MRLSTVSVQDAMPVRRFEVADLADTVVIAGPNGVGKTRLIDAVVNALRSPGAGGPVVQAGVVATNQDERDAWGKTELDLTNPEDAQRLTQMLQVGRRRRKWTSSLINFESDRSIQQLQPLQWAWDMPDPDEESVGWDLTYG